ncbi:MAG: DUF2752 domain-containing protein [Candidatus Hydrogenedentes bacterium]|nr:DUF2752 domain-containing protein [Candidatus Hydrogenedentota bacterium]
MVDESAEVQETEGARAARFLRVTASIIGFGCAGIVVIATFLTPDPRGFGTHEQLGLPPCVSTKFLHVPCPVCGMTTAFSLMAHARPIDAFRTQPAGTAFFVICLFGFGAAQSTFVLGHVPPFIARIASSRQTMWAIGVLLTAGWLYKVYILYH